MSAVNVGDKVSHAKTTRGGGPQVRYGTVVEVVGERCRVHWTRIVHTVHGGSDRAMNLRTMAKASELRPVAE